jgi:FkbM family methyltransferase
MANDSVQRGWLDRSNDLACRDLSCRAFRFVRARIRHCALNAILLADEPRVWKAWKKGWEAQHYAQLLRWRDEGFRPSVFYDIGAHRGIWSEMCQAVFAPESSILFEPQREREAEILGRRDRAGGNWELMRYALGDQDGQTLLHVNDQSAASSLLPPEQSAPKAFWGGAEARQEEVQLARLDGLVASRGLRRPDLVKMDVQGFEAKALAGGAATIRLASRLVIEVSVRPIYEGQPLFPEILHLLTGWGFVLEDITEALRQWPRGGLWQIDLWFRNDSRPR